MLKKMNRKGFTLVELLVTIAILGILGSVTVVGVTNYYQKSKEKAEEAFTKQLENYVEDYISLYGSTLKYSSSGTTKNKCYTGSSNAEVCNTVLLYPATTATNPNFDTIVDKIVKKDLINPSTKVECTSTNTKVAIYRDTDFVYCFKLTKVSGKTACISEDIDTCTRIYK